MCFILANGFGAARHKDEPEGWIIWSDTSDSQWYESAALNEHTKEITWENVDFCAKCSLGSPCYGGMCKTIFGKCFDKVYCGTFRFDNPSAEALEYAKKLVELRKRDIDKSGASAPKEN